MCNCELSFVADELQQQALERYQLHSVSFHCICSVLFTYHLDIVWSELFGSISHLMIVCCGKVLDVTASLPLYVSRGCDDRQFCW